MILAHLCDIFFLIKIRLRAPPLDRSPSVTVTRPDVIRFGQKGSVCHPRSLRCPCEPSGAAGPRASSRAGKRPHPVVHLTVLLAASRLHPAGKMALASFGYILRTSNPGEKLRRHGVHYHCLLHGFRQAPEVSEVRFRGPEGARGEQDAKRDPGLVRPISTMWRDVGTRTAGDCPWWWGR